MNTRLWLSFRQNTKLSKLFAACENGNLEEVGRITKPFLFLKGADVNAKNENGSTPLILALDNGFKEVAELLIAKGVEVNIQNNNGDTALILAASWGHTEIVNSLLAKSAEVNVRNKDGDTALMCAARQGHTEIVNSLLAKGPDVNVKNNNGATALTLASDKGHKEIVDSLLAKGAAHDSKVAIYEKQKKFDRIKTKSAKKAVDVLFNEALKSLKFSDEESIQELFESSKIPGYGFKYSWGSKGIIKGKKDELYNRVLLNLERTSKIAEFNDFIVGLFQADFCAEIISSVSSDYDPGCVSVCLFRTADSLYLFGNLHFE